jgi:ubiquinone/menaquinone biosynthesis C-methylase UbiE
VTSTGETQQERDKRRRQRQLFDAVAGQYEQSRPGYPAPVIEFIIATAGLQPGARVLEIGCGTGQLTAQLAGRGLRLTAIDIGQAMIAAARQHVADRAVRFEATSFEALAAAAASFDLVVSSAAFHWIDPQIAFSKTARLLRPGGWIALLGTAERYADPVGAGLRELWLRHGDTGGAWDSRPSDPVAITATGLFGPVTGLTDEREVRLPAATVVALEQTRATYLGWPAATQRRFTEDLIQLLSSHPVVPTLRHTPVAMAPRATAAPSQPRVDRF